MPGHRVYQVPVSVRPFQAASGYLAGTAEAGFRLEGETHAAPETAI